MPQPLLRTNALIDAIVGENTSARSAFVSNAVCSWESSALIADQSAVTGKRSIPLPIQIRELTEIAKTASLIMQEVGLTDTEIGMHLDVMGEVLRCHQIPAPRIHCQAINLPGLFVGITMQAHVKVSATTVFALNVELAQKMQDRNIAVRDRFALLFGSALQ